MLAHAATLMDQLGMSPRIVPEQRYECGMRVACGVGARGSVPQADGLMRTSAQERAGACPTS